MLTSVYDKRHYRFTTLNNGLKVLLVEDSQCKISAVSATISAGNFNDPPDIMGLSHLLEHMLFLGDQEQPIPNGFSTFLAEHGGNINACTGTEYSSYYFDVPREQLATAVKNFASMLRFPLFDQALIDKEINAIDAEFKLKLKDDLRRLYQVHKETCNPQHPFSHFSSGNEITLRHIELKQLQARLQSFHQHFYQPNNMSICLISNNTLTDSLAYIKHAFNGWEATTPITQARLPPLYLPCQLGIQINIKPLKNARRLIVTFALPGTSALYRSKPLSILSHLIGEEGHGSLLNYFKKMNWATNLSAGGGIEGENFKDFNINLQLTNDGTEHIEDILAGIFYYLLLIREQGLLPWRISEIKTLNQLIWDFDDPGKPIDEAFNLSHAIFEYPPEHIIAGEYLLDQPDIAHIRELLSYFSPTNMRLKVVQPDVVCDQQAQWYDTPYRVCPLSDALINTLLKPDPIPQLNLPKANPYLNIKMPQQVFRFEYKLPLKIFHRDGFNVWYAQDHKFKLPKGDCYLSFDCQGVNNGLEAVTIKRLWIALLNEQLKQKYYQANVAGLHFHLYPHQRGFSLQTGGFSTRQLDFCLELIQQVKDKTDFQSCFEQVREKQYLGLSNSLLNKPINRLFSSLSVIMQQNTYAPSQMASVLEKVRIEQIVEVKNTLLARFHLEVFIHGDWQRKQANYFAHELEHFAAPYINNNRVATGVADLRKQGLQVHKVHSEHTDAAVVVYLQSPGDDMVNVALTILTEQLLSAPFFNQLRTQQQLGYLVGSGYLPFNQHPGLSFYVQSPLASAAQQVEAIHSFLQRINEDLLNFSSLWLSLKNGIIKQLGEKDINLSMKSQRLWMGIGNNDQKFDQHVRLINTVAQLDFETFCHFYRRLVRRDGFGELILYSDTHSTLGFEFDFLNIPSIEHFKTAITYL
ncbi:MAG: insulysin [Paraglaciecola sp.]